MNGELCIGSYQCSINISNALIQGASIYPKKFFFKINAPQYKTKCISISKGSINYIIIKFITLANSTTSIRINDSWNIVTKDVGLSSTSPKGFIIALSSIGWTTSTLAMTRTNIILDIIIYATTKTDVVLINEAKTSMVVLKLYLMVLCLHWVVLQL